MSENQDLKSQFHNCMPLFIALGDEVRLGIVEALSAASYPNQKGLNVNEITKKTNLSRPAVSHHLKILKDAGFLYVRRQGTWAYYGINNELLKLHLDLFENIKNLELKNVIKKNENIITQICP